VQKVFMAFNELCTGCHTCEIMCSLKHTGTVNPSMARVKVVRSRKDHATFPIICRHCKNAPCEEACPIPSAMYVDAGTGAVVIDQDKCIQCFACIDACPFGAIQVGPGREILKCDLCGGEPVCVEHCPAVPGYLYPHMPWPTQSCLQYVEPSKRTRNKRLTLAERGWKHVRSWRSSADRSQQPKGV
jgi:Fe-S-cluster-containing hydrogenase component 2